jgi:hypothetical protein
VPPNDSIEAASKHASDVGHPPAGTFDGLGATAVVNASTRLASVVRLTSLERSYRLSDELGVTVLLKREDQQITRSYKVRGAYNLTLIFHRSSQTLYSDSETVLSRVDRTRRPAVEVWVAALGRRVGLKCQSKMTSGMAAPSLG